MTFNIGYTVAAFFKIKHICDYKTGYNSSMSNENSLQTNLTSLNELVFRAGENEEKQRKNNFVKEYDENNFCDSACSILALSKSLPKESLRLDCEYVEDEISDGDLIEVQNSPHNFQNRRSGFKRCLVDGKLFLKQNDFKENSLHIEKCDLISQSYDTSSAIQELDAVLEIHDVAPECSNICVSQMDNINEQNNIEDCLLDLDDYLEKIDKSIEDANCPSKQKCFADGFFHNLYDVRSLQRGHNLRRTLACLPRTNSNNLNEKLQDTSELNPIYGTVRRGKFKFLFDTKREADKMNTCGEYNKNNNDGFTVYSKCNNQMNRNNPEQKSSFNNDVGDRHARNNVQALSDEQIFQNIIEQHARHSIDEEVRPRQYGRRAERISRVSLPHVDGSELPQIANRRPTSAPAIVPMSLIEQNYRIGICNGSDESTVRSSLNTSPVTVVSSSESCDSSGTSHTIPESNLVAHDEQSQQVLCSPTDISSEPDAGQKPGFNAYWPHNYSRIIALISCSLGLFNVCRFAILSINYGANFLIQFLILSLIFGIPFFWLQMCLGSKIKAGPVSMWKISPICSGIGIALVLVQYFIAIYSSVVIIWLLVYIGDTIMFQSSYRWAETPYNFIPRNESQAFYNITESIPDYFNINVLQRIQILHQTDNKSVQIHISDRLAFYLVLLWASVFLILCKGLKSFGKVVFVIGTLPLITMTVVVGKLLCLVNLKKLENVFSASELNDFLINTKTWTAAAQETFLTWGLLGASVIAITSRNFKNLSKMNLRRDAVLVVILTLYGLCLSAIMGLCCIQILNQAGYVYVPGSFEKPPYYSAVYSLKSPTNSDILSYPTKYVPHYSSLIGEVYRRNIDTKHISGYQVLRFVTELFPAVVTIDNENISWIWVAVVTTMFFVFGMAQLCAMWKPISSALGNSTSSVLLSCVTGLLLSIPFATEVGITLLHYLDILIGGSWFIPILWALEIFGVFLIRGRPYNGDDLVNDLKMSGSMSAFLALSWNVLLPISLITFSIVEYKVSLSSQLYYWRGRSYYAHWARKLGAFTQIAFLLLVPITAIIQIYRYLTSGPPDILDRIQMLYRPSDDISTNSTQNICSREFRYRLDSSRGNSNCRRASIHDDEPPKYTPPPSYTTATGAKIAKILRQSIRRSVRRLLGGSGRSRPIISINNEQDPVRSRFPPEYLTVLPNPSSTFQESTPSISESIEIYNRANPHTIYRRCQSLGRKQSLKKQRFVNQTNFCRPSSESGDTPNPCIGNHRPYTAEDVITILRSSIRARNRSSHSAYPQSQILCRSYENLVLNAEPPGICITSNQLSESNHNNSSVI